MPDELLKHLDAIESVVSVRPCGLLTDIDGTISEVAPRPIDAKVSARCRERLGALVGRLDLVAVLSGRPVLDARRMVGLSTVLYVGDHGLEGLEGVTVVPDPRATEYREMVRATAALIFGRLAAQPGLEGLFLEDKGASFSFHYRACPDPVRARTLILEAMAGLDGSGRFKVMEARRAVELRPPLETNKGTALAALAQEFSLKGLFYLGDDYTDISAFRALKAWREGSPDTPLDRQGFPAPPASDMPPGASPLERAGCPAANASDSRGLAGSEQTKGLGRLEAESPHPAPGGQGRPPLRFGGRGDSPCTACGEQDRPPARLRSPFDPDRRGFPAPQGRRGLAIAVVSEGSPEEAQAEADFILNGVPEVAEFLGLLARLSAPGPGGPTSGGKTTTPGLRPG